MQESKKNIIIFTFYLLMLIDFTFISSILIFDKIIAYSDITGVVDTWGTIIAGVLAIVAARMTIQTMEQNNKESIDTTLKTIETMERNHKDLIERKKLATRHKLHIALSNICEYCDECIGYTLCDMDETPKLDGIYIDNFANHIKYADININNKLSVIIEKAQIQYSQLKKFPRTYDRFDKNSKHEQEKAQQCYTAIELYTITNNLFDYIQTAKIPANITNSILHKTMRELLEFYAKDREFYSKIEEIINKEYPK